MVEASPFVVAQPRKLKPLRVGSVGALTLVLSTNDPLPTELPPFALKVTEYVIACRGVTELDGELATDAPMALFAVTVNV